MKLKPILFSAFLTASAFTQAATSTSEANKLNALNSESIEVELELDAQTLRDSENSISGVGALLTLNNSYEFISGHAINLNAEFSHVSGSRFVTSNEFQTAEFGYSYSTALESLKTEMTTSLHGQYFVNSDLRRMQRTDGLVRFNIETATTFSSSISLENELEYIELFTEAYDKGVVSRAATLELKPVYAFNDIVSAKLPVAMNVVAFEGQDFSDAYYTTIAPTIGWQLGTATELEAYVEVAPFISNDQEFIHSDFAKESSFGLTLTHSVF